MGPATSHETPAPTTFSLFGVTTMDFLSHPLVIAVLASLAPAIKGDIDAFRTFKSFEEAASYSWGTFAWRVFQGALLGVGGYFATFGAVAGIQSLVK